MSDTGVQVVEDREGSGGDEPPETPPDQWSVTGLTAPVGDRQIQVVVRVVGSSQSALVATSSVDATDSRFEAVFRAADLEPGVVDFTVATLDPTTGAEGDSIPIDNADRLTTLTEPLTLPRVRLGYSVLRATIRRVLIERGDVASNSETLAADVDAALFAATDEGLDTLAEKSGIPNDRVRLLAESIRTKPKAMPTAIALVLRDAGLSLAIDDLREREDIVRSAVELAIADGSVTTAELGVADKQDPGDHVVAHITSLSWLENLERPAISGGSTMSGLIGLIAQGDAAVSEDDRLLLARLAEEHGVASDAFWAGLEVAEWRSDADRVALQTLVRLDEMTGSSLPLVAHLFAIDPPLSTQAGLILSPREWEDLIKDAGSGGSAVPERFRSPATSKNAQRKAYAASIMIGLRRASPAKAAAILIQQVASETGQANPLPLLAERLRLDPEFGVLDADLSGDQDALRERQILRRALHSEDPVADVIRLAAQSTKPAIEVARMGQRAFVKRDGGAESYRDAAFANAALLTMFSDLRAAAAAPRAEERTDLADWVDLFGEIDDTVCEHCSSVYSPGAYLVDILRFVRDRGLADVLLASERRPDLESIRLDCVNTKTPLPYIDLVNEILESAVLMSAEIVPLPPVGQTTITSADELRTHPEHLESRAYDHLRSAVHPFSAPFDLWEAEARAYLTLAGVDRAELRRLVSDNNSATVVDELGLFEADLAILDGRTKPSPDYGAPSYKKNANLLRQLTDLSFDELGTVLGTDYVRSGSEPSTLLLDESPESIGGTFTKDHARRIHRLLLLGRRMAIESTTLDRLLRVAGGISRTGEIHVEALAELAAMQRLSSTMEIPLDRVALLFAESVDTQRDASGRSDFDDWFAKPSATGEPVPAIFTLDDDRSELTEANALIEENDAELRTALGLDDQEFASLQTVVDPALNLGTMADLLRWFVLGTALRLSIDEVIALSRASGIQAFARRSDPDEGFDIRATEKFVEAATTLKSAGGSVALAESILLNPLTEEDRSLASSPAAALAAAVSNVVAAEVAADTDRNAQLEEVLSEALDLDLETVAHLIDAVVATEFGLRRTVRETLLAPTDPGTEASLLLATDRLLIAASLVKLLGLPSDTVGLLFDEKATWLDPNIVPLSASDLSTETERPEVLVQAEGVARAAADGTAVVPLEVLIDGEPATDGSGLVWSFSGDAEIQVNNSSGAWAASIKGVGAVTLIATVPSNAEGRTEGVGAATINVRPHENWPSRTAEGLLALYQFHEGAGTTVKDISGVGDPLDLSISGDVTWRTDGGLTTGAGALISSGGPATKIIDAVRAQGEMTMEAWITPGEQNADGPARIITISADPHERNATLAQRGRGIVARFRTEETGDNGSSPATATPSGLDTNVVHVVYTRSADGGRIYLDGREVTHQPRVRGNTENWSDDMVLALAGEIANPDNKNRHWRGTYHLVAIYGRALATDEVLTHATAGPVPALDSPTVAARGSQVTMLPWESTSVAVELTATVEADLPEATSVEWTLHRGPAPVEFGSPDSEATTVSFGATGEYLLGVRARDRRDPGAWSESTMSIRVAADPAGVPGRWQRFFRALDFSRTSYTLMEELGQESPALFGLLAEALKHRRTARLTRTFVDGLGSATGVGPRVDAIIDDPRLRLRTFGTAHDGTAIVRIARVASFARRTGSAPRHILAWADEQIDSETAGVIKAAVRSTFERDRWLTEASEVRDELRAQQRDASVAHLVARGIGSLQFDSSDDLYGHFLIDVDMSPCQLTSRLKQALSSVQQFVQRTLLGIEGEAELKADDAFQWKWMKSYRMWEANRKIFLHPENWLEPELRTDKSPFFEELESELSQAELTDDSAALAFEHYLEKMHGVAELEIVGLCQEHDGSAPTEPSVQHLIGRTRGQPKRYWHRTLTAGVEWSPWRAIDADVSGDHIVPVWHNSRLHLFWAEFQTKDESPRNVRSNSATARRFATCRLSCVELRSKGWTAKVLSDGERDFEPTGQDGGRVLDPAVDPTFSLFSFHVRTDPRTNDLHLDVGYRIGEEMLVWPGFVLAGSGTGLRAVPGAARRQRTDRPIVADLHVGFGFGSHSSTTLRAMPATDADTGRLIPTLTGASEPPILVYEATGTDAPMIKIPQTTIFLAFRQFALTTQARAMGWNVSTRIMSVPSPRIFPTPPPQHYVHFTVHNVSEQDKSAVEQWLRANFRFVEVSLSETIARAVDFLLLNHVAPPWTAVSSRRSDLPFDQLPIVFQDQNAGFLVDTLHDPNDPRQLVGLNLLTHPLVGDLRRAFGSQGVAGILSSRSELRHQALSRPIADQDTYVTDRVSEVPTASLDFGIADAFGSYHWELFFHVPLLLAKQLMRSQRFDEAQQWLHFIFDPTSASSKGTGRDDPWQIKPFRRAAMSKAADDLLLLLDSTESDTATNSMRDQVDHLLGQIHEHPFEPHVVARLRTSAYKKSVVMTYLDNLIAWADHLFSLDTLESLNEAAQLYIMAADILGERPAQKPARQSIQLTAAELENAPVAPEIADVLSRVRQPSAAAPIGAGSEPPAITLELRFCVPPNPKLLGYWDVVADRLHKVRHCQNIQGIERALALFAPPIDPGALVRAAAAGTGGAGALVGLAVPTPHHRFRVLHGRALTAADHVRRLGRTLTHALEARDSARLVELLSMQDVGMQRGTRSLLRLQRDEAKDSLASLDESRKAVAAHKDFVDAREDETALEVAAFSAATVGITLKTVGAVLHQVAGFVGTVPEMNIGASGISSPVVVTQFGGSNLFKALDGVATGLETGGDVLKDVSDLVGRRAEIERRKGAFAQEKVQASIDLTRLDKEVAAAEKRVDIANDNIATLEAIIANAEETQEVLRRRFTDEELWGWMVGRASSLHFQAYATALDLARRAERACQIELDTDDSFVSPGNWDSLRKGLLAGEGLIIDLTRMEVAHLDGQQRRHELSLRMTLSELGVIDALRRDGVVEIVIPESALDRRTPGHYLRKVKSVAVTVRGNGPARSLPAKVTLLRGTTRVSNDVSDGYPRDEAREDRRFADDLQATSIVTSGRAEDTGLFVRDYDDDRYLPFEEAGLAESRWRIDLFPDTRRDLRQVEDVELVIDYTALDGGEQLRRAAVKALA